MRKILSALFCLYLLALSAPAVAEPATEQTIREFLVISKSLERAEKSVDAIVENWRLIDPSLP